MWFGVWNIDRLRDQMHSAERADNQNSLDMQLKHSLGSGDISGTPNGLTDVAEPKFLSSFFIIFFLSLLHIHTRVTCVWLSKPSYPPLQIQMKIKTSKSHQTVNASRNQAVRVLPLGSSALSAWREQSDELWQGRGISCVNTGVAFPGSETWLVIKNWR